MKRLRDLGKDDVGAGSQDYLIGIFAALLFGVGGFTLFGDAMGLAIGDTTDGAGVEVATTAAAAEAGGEGGSGADGSGGAGGPPTGTTTTTIPAESANGAAGGNGSGSGADGSGGGAYDVNGLPADPSAGNSGNADGSGNSGDGGGCSFPFGCAANWVDENILPGDGYLGENGFLAHAITPIPGGPLVSGPLNYVLDHYVPGDSIFEDVVEFVIDPVGSLLYDEDENGEKVYRTPDHLDGRMDPPGTVPTGNTPPPVSEIPETGDSPELDPGAGAGGGGGGSG
ncbi:MAG: hypothetical protein KC416_12470, partial [Myxococcales bacterium]|nr:hypothetical protein [Myxococcales bacterium]